MGLGLHPLNGYISDDGKYGLSEWCFAIKAPIEEHSIIIKKIQSKKNDTTFRYHFNKK